MEKFITDERVGLQYEIIGDCYLITGENESEGNRIGLWDQWHLLYLKQYRRILYFNLLISGKLNDYLADLNEQVEELFFGWLKNFPKR